MKSKNTIWRLLRRNISTAQLTGYAVANLVGLTIVACAIQFYSDISSVWNDDDSFLSRDYTVISHKVSGLGSLVGSSGNSTFTPEEIADLISQPWVRRAAPFTPATFSVAATLDMNGANMSTALFFESIPDEMFDIRPNDWNFDPEHPIIPIIISKDYLSLYNFGFASSRGLPQLSEAMIGMVPLKISVSGNGKQQWIPARIVGFSSRLNTVAVPEEFMKWANTTFGETSTPAPSRIIVELKQPGDPAIKDYLAEHDYEASGDNADSGKASYFLSIATGVVISIGIIISLLSFFILMLSIYLLLQKNRSKLTDLMLLGYPPHAVARYYYILIAGINASVLIASIAIMLVSGNLWHAPLAAIGVHPAAPWNAIIVTTAIIAMITAVNILSIRRTMVRYFKS
ncbi:MAG: ABC transporter permease [Bacteroides sp.]|nr:ABC transporter permease [Bacteroides sp.]MCM1390645.1 ABC transporter permease [Bacteroides sp.]